MHDWRLLRQLCVHAVPRPSLPRLGAPATVSWQLAGVPGLRRQTRPQQVR